MSNEIYIYIFLVKSENLAEIYSATLEEFFFFIFNGLIL